MRLRGVLLLFLLLAIGVAYSQAQDSDYQKWLQKEQEKYQRFKDERDKEFTDFLKREWKQMQSFQGLVPDETPKPVRLPVYQPPPQPPKDTTSIPVQLKVVPPPKKQNEPQPKPTPLPPVSKAKKQLPHEVPFFNTRVTLQVDDATKPSLSANVSKDAISEFWAALSKSSYETLLAQVQRDRDQMSLNDWGYVQFLYKISQNIYSGSRNEQILFTWFMLAKSGYDSKVGYNNNQLYLLLPSDTRLYFVSYLCFANDQRRFYGPSLDATTKSFDGPLYTYEGKYPGADKSLDFTVKELPKLKREAATRKLQFTFEGNVREFTVRMSRDAVDFFTDYPLTDMKQYFDAPASTEATQSLLPQLKAALQGKTELVAVNLLLRFVQTAFEYKTDPDQFGKEKPLFPDETLFYPYSDCEDRSILFAYLVRQLLGLDVVGLDYPGHIATAVLFSTHVSGDAVEYQSKRYVICDPTYINADAGACMPQFKSVNPNIIPIASHAIEN
jgi:hypothetical protein